MKKVGKIKESKVNDGIKQSDQMFCLLLKKELTQLCWDALKRNTTQLLWDGGSIIFPKAWILRQKQEDDREHLFGIP